MFKLIKSKAFKLYFILSLSLIGYVVLGYFTPRTEFYILVLLFGILFLGYAYLISLELENRMIQQGIYAAILFRGMLLLMMPNLSDDIYRFVWDGNLLANGINPFLVLPSQFIQSTQAQQIGFNLELYQSLNSPEYYTIYPPVLQAVFYIAAKISSTHILGNVLVMRICILASEIGSIYLITKLLELFKLPSKNIFLYALNPLVIIELTGNIHFEAFLIFFLLLALYFMLKEKLMLSALAFALSVGSKLIPLMVLPLLMRWIGFKKSILFYVWTGIFTLLLFLPFLSMDFILHVFSSIQLYVQTFEFNASIYYVVRWIGYQFTGYNIIASAGITLSLLTLVGILVMAYLQKGSSTQAFLTTALWSITLYFVLATTVHPWYITTLVMLCTFTSRYPILWSGLIVSSYSAYAQSPYTENLYLVGLEYVLLLGFLVYECKTKTMAYKPLLENQG